MPFSCHYYKTTSVCRNIGQHCKRIHTQVVSCAVIVTREKKPAVTERENYSNMPREIITLQAGQCGNQSITLSNHLLSPHFISLD